MKIVVLGGRGFIGNHVVEGLRLSGSHEVVTVGRKATSSDVDSARHVVCNLFAADAPLTEIFDGADACVHLAGDLVPGSAESAGWAGYMRNLELANRLADACIASGVGRLIFASSGGTVYGRDVLRAREEMACQPVGMYGAQKLAIESLLRARMMRSDCKLIILRAGNPFGAGQETQCAHGVIGRIFTCMRDGDKFTVWGDGSQVRDYIHVSDLAEAFCCALSYSGVGDTFNIGSGQGVSMDALIALCADVAGVRLHYSCRAKSEFEVDRISLDIGAAERHLQWRPAMTVTEGLTTYYKQIMEMK